MSFLAQLNASNKSGIIWNGSQVDDGVPTLAGSIAVCMFATTGVLINVVSSLSIVHARPLESSLKLLLSLACSDILMSFAYIVQMVVGFIAPRHQLGYFLVGFFLATSLLSVFLSVIAITMERYLFIIYPLRYHVMVNEKKVTVGILIQWTAAIAIGVVCGSLFVVLRPSVAGSVTNILLVSVVSVPITAMFILYVRVGLELRKLQPHPGTSQTSTTKGAVTAALIMGSFMLFCVPPAVLIAIIESDPLITTRMGVSIFDLYNGFACLNLSNTIFDPCIYGFRNARVGKGFKTLVARCKCNRKTQVVPM